MLFGLKLNGYWVLQNFLFNPEDVGMGTIVVTSIFNDEENRGEVVVFALEVSYFQDPEFGTVIERFDTTTQEETKELHFDMCNKYNKITENAKILLDGY